MVTIKDGCGCNPCDCDWKQKLKEAYARASVSVNKVGDFDGAIYYPDGTGFVKLPLPRQSDVAQIETNTQDIADLKVADAQLQANITAEENARIASITAEENARIESITAEETARKAKDESLDGDIARIDSTDARQTELIQDNADRINSTYNDLVATEATVATHESEISTLQANAQALTKSLVSDVLMTDGTTAGSVQVSIEREDGALITSANYRWGKDIGIRLEAGTQEGYVKAIISLSDGTELVSNEYKIVEVLESDVYVTAITLIADQTAGTLGGNISYSNGTTQTINSVSVPTAPGVTSAIEALQSRMTAVEQKNTQQDASISAIDSRVQTLENTPGVGQFASGKLGTIAGSTTDGRVKAEDDGTGSVNGWADLKGRVSTAEGQIVTAQNDITAIKTKNTQQDSDISTISTKITSIESKNRQQDTAISGLQTSKVNVAQGTGNAGKALVIGSDGNVTPGEISGGEVWEEVDLSNWPTDWAVGDRLKVNPKAICGKDGGLYELSNMPAVVELMIQSAYLEEPTGGLYRFWVKEAYLVTTNSVSVFNSGNNSGIILVYSSTDNYNNPVTKYGNLPVSSLSRYINKVWRLKK